MAVYLLTQLVKMDDLGFGRHALNRFNGETHYIKATFLLVTPQMPADFVNAIFRQCLATWELLLVRAQPILFNLEAIDGIKSGKFRVAMVGGSDAPINAGNHWRL